MNAETLHVTNGDSAASGLAGTTLGGSVLPWRDVLHEGPVPRGARAAFIESRAAFLASAGQGTADVLAASFRARDDELVVALRVGRPVVLWFEHDLYDQLQLLDVLALVHETAAPHETVELVQVGSFPGRPDFRGLGELSAAELETLWPHREGVGKALVADAAAAWDDVRADDPRALAARAGSGVDGLPFLSEALGRFLEELPGARDGLSRTERQLLQVLADGARSPVQTFLAAQELEDTPFHGDTWVFRALRELGRGESRLVETAAGAEVPESADAELVLTAAGCEVRSGEADRVALLGIDRWVGGTHVVAPGAVWRWDTAHRSLVAPG